MLKQTYVLIVILALFVSGCGDVRIDGTSKKAFQKSFNNMKRGMSETQRIKLAIALIKIAHSKNPAGMMKIKMADDSLDQEPVFNVDEVLNKDVRAAVDGMTAEEIIAYGNTLSPVVP